MSEVLHANIFFFITGIAVIVCAALLCVALIHGIKLLKSIRRIVAHIEESTEILSEDMQSIRMHIVEGGILRKCMHFLFGSKSSADNTSEESPTTKSKSAERKRSALKIKDES